MTISASVNRASFVGAASTGPFSYPYTITAPTDLVVLSVDDASDISTTLVLNTDYTLAGSADLQGRYVAGVNITTIVAVAVGKTLVAYSDPPLNQTLDLVENDPLPVEQVELGLDKLTLICRRLVDRVARTFRLSDGDTSGATTELPAPAASSGIGWNAAGTALVNYVFQTGTTLVNLAAAAGSSLIGFIQSGTGAVTRTLQDKNRDVYSIRDVSTIAQAIANTTSNELFIPPGTYALPATSPGVVIPSNITLRGVGSGSVNFTYAGSGVPMDVYGSSNVKMSGFNIVTSHVAATGIRLGNGSQHFILDDIQLIGDQSALNTGTAFFLDASGATNAFCGHLTMRNCYALGFKHGIRAVGTDATRTWTTMVFLNTFLIGRNAGIIAGGAGLSLDALTNGTGSAWVGGLIEGYGTGLSVANGCFGIDFTGDIEGCTVIQSIGSSFQGRIFLNAAATQYTATANQTTNMWTSEEVNIGQMARKSFYSQKFYVRSFGAPANSQIFGAYANVAGDRLMGAITNGSFATPEASWWWYGPMKITRGTAVPTGGALLEDGTTENWNVGDICWFSNAASGAAPGAMCTTLGQPGTWKNFGNLA